MLVVNGRRLIQRNGLQWKMRWLIRISRLTCVLLITWSRIHSHWFLSLYFSRSSFLDLFSHLSICSTNVQHLRHLIFHQYATYNTNCHGFVCSHHGTTISLVTRLAYLSPSRFVVVPFGSRVIWDFTFFFLSGWHVNSSHAVSSGSRTCATFFLVGWLHPSLPPWTTNRSCHGWVDDGLI